MKKQARSIKLHPVSPNLDETPPYPGMADLEEQACFALNSLMVVEGLLQGGAKHLDAPQDTLLAAYHVLTWARESLEKLDPVGVALAVENKDLILSPGRAAYCAKCGMGAKAQQQQPTTPRSRDEER